MENNSDQEIKFGFNKPNSEVSKQNNQTNNNSSVKESTVEDNFNEDYNSNDEYTDKRSVTIALVKSTSLYRKANDKVLPKRRDYIGSCCNSSKILKQYLNNIKIPVDELGKQFDTSFHYYHKKDYYKIKKEEEKIEQEYLSSNRQGTSNIKKALRQKINALNALETTKCTLGYPLNVEEYLMYRHCLLYSDVAKDMALINADSSIRFYFKDDQKEAERLKKQRHEINKAKANYVSCLADDSLFDAVYIQYCVNYNLPVISSLAESRIDREIKLDKFSTEEPTKFNKIFYNKDNKLIATIEMLIARGELVRSQYNQNITTNEGEFIGANMNEAIAWFKNPENNSIVVAYQNKLKNI